MEEDGDKGGRREAGTCCPHRASGSLQTYKLRAMESLALEGEEGSRLEAGSHGGRHLARFGEL